MFLGLKNYKTEKKKNLSGKIEFEAGWVHLSQCVYHFLALLPQALQWLFTIPCALLLGSFTSTCREAGEPDSILSALWEQQHRIHKSLSWYSQEFFCAFSEELVVWLKNSQMLMVGLKDSWQGQVVEIP